jgi:DNA-binding CsgD family transcriptional regulator
MEHDEVARVVAARVAEHLGSRDGRPGAAQVLSALTRGVVTAAGRYDLRGAAEAKNDTAGALVIAVVLERAPSDAEFSGRLIERYSLTPREAAVARFLARRRSTAEIADALGISTHTARHHAERVLAKLGVRSRAAAAAKLATEVQRSAVDSS